MPKKLKLNLEGIDGNAYALLSAFKREAHKSGWTVTEQWEVLKEAQSGDYDHLLQTLIKHTN